MGVGYLCLWGGWEGIVGWVCTHEMHTHYGHENLHMGNTHMGIDTHMKANYIHIVIALHIYK